MVQYRRPGDGAYTPEAPSEGLGIAQAVGLVCFVAICGALVFVGMYVVAAGVEAVLR